MVVLLNRNMVSEVRFNPEQTKEENVLRLLQEKGAVSRKDVERFMGSSSFPEVNTLNALLKDGKIIKSGAGRGTKYTLKD